MTQVSALITSTKRSILSTATRIVSRTTAVSKARSLLSTTSRTTRSVTTAASTTPLIAVTNQFFTDSSGAYILNSNTTDLWPNSTQFEVENATGGPSFSDEFRGFLIACYTLSTILAVAGNIMCVIVFAEQRRRSNQPETFTYLINLAVCDILMAIFCIPFTAINFLYQWIFPHFLCPLVLFCQMCFVIASIGTNICISLHRLNGILRPLDLSSHSNLVTASIVGVWLFAACVSTVNFGIGGVNPMSNQCGEIHLIEGYEALWQYTISTLMLFLPMTVIILVYSGIGYILFIRPSGLVVAAPAAKRPNNNTKSGGRPSAEDKRLDDRRKLIVTLFCVALCFCIGWSPIHIFFIAITMDPSLQEHEAALYIYALCHIIAMSHSFHNPVVYLCSKHFRDTLFNLGKGRRRRAVTERIRSGTHHERSCLNQSEISNHVTHDRTETRLNSQSSTSVNQDRRKSVDVL